MTRPSWFNNTNRGIAEVDDCRRPVDDSDWWLEREYDEQQLIRVNDARRVRRAAKEARS